MMVTSIANSMWSLLWALTLLILILFQFALVFTNAVDIFLREHRKSRKPDGPQHQMLQECFGNMLKSIFTLYQTITNGRSWYEFIGALKVVDMPYASNFYEYLFYGFTGFAVLGVLNVVTGIFVQGSLAKVSAEKDAMIIEE